MTKRGVFVVFEGIDASGKSIHIKYISNELRRMGYNVLQTKEPSKGSVGNFIKRYARVNEKRLPPETEVLLFAADRFEHVKNIIEPNLKRDRIVISDRYLYSSLAYQGAAKVNLDWIREINQFAPMPDLCILLDILPDYSLRRTRRQHTIFEDVEYLRKVRNVYLRLADQGELVRVDADRPKRAVQAELLALVQELLKSRGDG